MRSLLFIPADDEKKLAKGLATGADGLILDLEDAVSAANKSAARALAKAYIEATAASAHRPQILVRINALDTPYWQDDLIGVMTRAPMPSCCRRRARARMCTRFPWRWARPSSAPPSRDGERASSRW